MPFSISEYYARLAEMDEFRIETLREPGGFANAAPTEDETLRLGNAKDMARTGPNSLTVMLRLASSCAGWPKRPTAREFYDAIRVDKPTQRQRAIVGTFAQEADWQELIAAWAERAYTLRELVTALHRSGHAKCYAARWLNGWTTAGEEP